MPDERKKKKKPVKPLKNRVFRLDDETMRQLQDAADLLADRVGGKQTRSDALRTLAKQGLLLDGGKPHLVPDFGKVPCGKGRGIQDESPVYIDLSSGWRGPNVFTLTAAGTSMIDRHIADGDRLVLRKQDTAENGQIVVAVAGGEVTVKTYVRRINQDTREVEHLLMPANSDMKVIRMIPGDDNRIIGVLLGVIRKC